MHCSECGKEIRDASVLCDECGARIADDNTIKKKSSFPINLIVFMVIVGLIVVAGIYIKNTVPIRRITLEELSEIKPSNNISASGSHVSEGLEFCSNGDGTAYISGVGTCVDTSIVIPATSPSGDLVTEIGEGAFSGDINLESLAMPGSITRIGSYAFYGCINLRMVQISDCVTSIGISAFEGCQSLTTMIIPNALSRIEDKTFMNCSGLTTVSIPDSVTSIGVSAFENCQSLTSIIIPESVNSIEDQAFMSCNSLVSVEVSDSVVLGLSVFEGHAPHLEINGVNSTVWYGNRGV